MYYVQVQCQMAVGGVTRRDLVIYTKINKGINVEWILYNEGIFYL